MVQISLVYPGTPPAANDGITFNAGTWWWNYSLYTPVANSGGLLQGHFSGITLLSAPYFFKKHAELELDVHGFAIKIRGYTYNGYDGRGGPYGNTYCLTDPQLRPLGIAGCTCCADGVEDWEICGAGGVPPPGFTYNGCFVDSCGNLIC